MDDNQGISSFVEFVRTEAQQVNEVVSDPPSLADVIGSSILIDGTTEPIPQGDYSLLRGLNISSGDRVLCISAGGTYVIVGVVE